MLTFLCVSAPLGAAEGSLLSCASAPSFVLAGDCLMESFEDTGSDVNAELDCPSMLVGGDLSLMATPSD